MRRFIEALFPDAAADARGWRHAALVALIVVVVTFGSLARQSGVAATDTLWAEDGAFFLGDALHRSFFSTLLRPLGGYTHVAPRVLGEVASWLPVRSAAVVLSGGAALLTAVVAAVAYLSSGGFFRSRTARVVVASAPVLFPIASYEVLNAAANLHFLLLYGAFWALLWAPRTWSGRVAAALLLFVTTTSDPQSILLVPLVAARVIARWPVRTRWRDHVPTAAYAVGLAIQLAVDATTSRGFGERAPVDQLARLYPLRVASAVAGGRVVDPMWRVLGDWLTAAVSLALVVLVVLALRRGRRTRPLVLAASVLSVAYWVGPLAFRWSDRMRPTVDAVGLNGSRYGMVPALLVVVIAAVAVEGARRRWVVPVALGAVLVFAAIGFRSDNGRMDGPRWRDGVAAATSTCRADATKTDVAIPISPAGWSVTVPCTRLR